MLASQFRADHGGGRDSAQRQDRRHSRLWLRAIRPVQVGRVVVVHAAMIAHRAGPQKSDLHKGERLWSAPTDHVLRAIKRLPGAATAAPAGQGSCAPLRRSGPAAPAAALARPSRRGRGAGSSREKTRKGKANEDTTTEKFGAEPLRPNWRCTGRLERFRHWTRRLSTRPASSTWRSGRRLLADRPGRVLAGRSEVAREEFQVWTSTSDRTARRGRSRRRQRRVLASQDIPTPTFRSPTSASGS